jgi:agmatinase
MAGLRYRTQEYGFLGLGPEERPGEPEAAKAVIIPFGLEASVCYGSGTAAGPEAIIAASPQLDYFLEELWCEPFRQYGIATLEPQSVVSAHEEALNQLDGLVQSVLAAGKFPLVLGGEHSLTIGAVRPLVRRHPDLVIVQFDAHADLRDGYQGNHYSHAAAMRRVLEMGPGVSLVSIGIRCISAGEIAYYEANRDRITIHFAKDQKSWRVEDIVAPLRGRPVYISFDVDGLDASLMPATGTPEAGGLFFLEACELLRAVAEAGNVVGADLVELAPMPGYHAADYIAAKLAYKIMSYVLAKGQAPRG